MIHNGGDVEDDGVQQEDLYVVFGDETQEILDQKLKRRVTGAARNGL